ncbi:MAG: ABC transporter ATP-binding protein [Caldilineaceae bacterium]
MHDLNLLISQSPNLLLSMNPIITLQNIVKIYPPNLVALDKVSVDFLPGEIHAIVGENGAGKSTLMKVLYGQEAASAGVITYQDKPVHFRHPGEAIANGIGMVHQEILLIPEYTVWQNIVLGAEPVDRWGRLDVAQARRQVGAKIAEFGFQLDPDALAGDLSVAAQQKVEILKLLYRNVTVLILDEPTAVLTPQEIPQLFTELRRLRETGRTILFISHHLDEVLALSDRITVLRKGRFVATVTAAETNEADLARMMVGRDLRPAPRRVKPTLGKAVFTVQNLSYVDKRGRHLLADINLVVRAGEIVGVAGVEGNGQFELAQSIIGLLLPSSGEIQVNGESITQLPILARRDRVSFVPQNRRTMGAAVTASITENVLMTHHRLNPRFTRWGGRLLDMREADRFTDEVEAAFGVVMRDNDQPFGSLSGGNQQKIILGRELALDNPFVLLDQPTRGLDVGSIEYVHGVITRLSEEGRAVLLISADLEELFALADRIVVLHRGRLVADLPTGETTIAAVGHFMLEGQR